jgi:hypothetical protein
MEKLIYLFIVMDAMLSVMKVVMVDQDIKGVSYGHL